MPRKSVLPYSERIVRAEIMDLLCGFLEECTVHVGHTLDAAETISESGPDAELMKDVVDDRGVGCLQTVKDLVTPMVE